MPVADVDVEAQRQDAVRVGALELDDTAAHLYALTAPDPVRPSRREPGRNPVREVFLGPEARRLFPDWAEIAAQTAAALRAEADPHDPETARLVAELAADEDFRRLWARHDVRPARDELKRFAHPEVGDLALRRQALTVGGAEHQVIIVYQAAPGSPSEAALARLL